MEKSFNLNIISPKEIIYAGKVFSLVAPCALGYLGVLADHAPLAATLFAGKIIVRKESGETAVFPCQGKGFLEVLKNEATLILSQ